MHTSGWLSRLPPKSGSHQAFAGQRRDGGRMTGCKRRLLHDQLIFQQDYLLCLYVGKRRKR